MTLDTGSGRAGIADSAATRTIVTGRRGGASRRHVGDRGEQRIAWLFLAPFLVAFALFLVWPLLHGLYLSFTDQSLTGAGGSFVGITNYIEALGDPVMWRSLGNTAWFTVLSTIPLVLLALIMALLVQRGLPGQWLWRLSFFMPYLLASTVISQIWVWIFNPQIGAANGILEAFGLEPIAWLQNPDTNMLAIVIATVWWTVGFNFLLYLAALQNIPERQYEAASIDGAGEWRKLFSITIPQLGPITVLIVILQVLASLKLFDQAYQMLGGIASETTRSIVQYIYESGFVGYRFGYSAAISYVFFAVIVVIGVIQALVTRRRKEHS
ncbi:carbohydrate ABC transporter permease [Microbacterium imperiale]|uniref:Sugar ABC transporter permease n=1 Tax=Microbacterium imperiale TaxID=33884 RepID=A0A9W6HHW8_9MICO|nr:sugar ABC transporter permease [Microbacterium imperiale]MBP2421416.1 ABC-type sugar transport system permease subunit [Microbacterium imperiale]MDS0199477.1 sugar ABC transporter permease [Microbacterium imperiale]BFE41755.1 sugar ABC transporter permease [Microbacterium imperiale]GLJ80707.1 sugar ABC transporter permease [Microbacterium imperiale]